MRSSPLREWPVAAVSALVLTSGAACLAWQGPVPQTPFVDTGQRLGKVEVFTETCADLNGDGTPDCVLASVALGGTVQVFLNKGGILADTGQLLPIRPDSFYLWNFGIVLADVNRDGRLDLVTADAVRGTNVYIGDATGRFLPSSQVLWDQDVREMKGLALGDFDDDGDLDMVVGDYWAPARVFFNDGFGSYQDSGQRLNFIRGWRIAVGDVNGDGYLDLA